MSFKTNLLNCSALAVVGLIPATCWSAVFWDETTQDLLPQIGSGTGAQGFIPPLPADSYTLWLQQLGQPTTYQLEFQVTPVPEPKSASVCAAALLVAAWVIRRRRRRFELG